jgi:hypothetical protein
MEVKMDIQNLAIITIILFAIYYLLVSTKEHFDQIQNQDKACSQKAINDSYMSYIFGGVKSVR